MMFNFPFPTTISNFKFACYGCLYNLVHLYIQCMFTKSWC